MNAITTTTTTSPPMPVRSDVAIRVATLPDLPFMDALQKKHSKQLGYFPTKQFEGYIATGGVLIAQETERVGVGLGVGVGPESNLHPTHTPTRTHTRHPTPLGYIIAKDRYLKRDELGVVYQLCVAPGVQRKLVGASLLKAVFERSAYGCKLYCCWCAQDLAANHFWESMGFVPIAFRAGSSGKRRVHIFWQRRINADDGVTPYWYPSQTNSGAIREDRLVFPIPPGTHWGEVRAVQLPVVSGQLSVVKTKNNGRRTTDNGPAATPATIAAGGLRFAAPEPAKAKPVKAPRAKVKNDPKHVAAARELRDRYLERVNEGPMLAASGGKYDVSRSLPPVEAHAAPHVAPHLSLPPPLSLAQAYSANTNSPEPAATARCCLPPTRNVTGPPWIGPPVWKRHSGFPATASRQ